MQSQESLLTSLRRVDLASAWRLYRAPLPSPVDVLNLIQFRDRAQYRRYAQLVFPWLTAVGGRVRWAGAHVAALRGESRGEELFVVRYPNHRRFLTMVLSPYYLALANPYRVSGVRRFEASFTTPSSGDRLSRCELALVVHSSDEVAGAALARALTEAGGAAVYESRECSPIGLTRPLSETDPNPLRFRNTAFFEFPDESTARAAVAKLRCDADAVAIQLYRRIPAKDMLRGRGAA